VGNQAAGVRIPVQEVFATPSHGWRSAFQVTRTPIYPGLSHMATATVVAGFSFLESNKAGLCGCPGLEDDG